MKYALQIYGVFRTFEVCLPEILHYIAYDKRDIDVYILAQKADGYSPENEEKIRKMLGAHHIAWRYIEDYPTDVHKEEDQLCKEYERCVVEAKKKLKLNIISNHFVTRLWCVAHHMLHQHNTHDEYSLRQSSYYNYNTVSRCCT